MRTEKNIGTVLIECIDKDVCKSQIKALKKKYSRNIRAVHETIPFTNASKVLSALYNPKAISIGRANYIVELTANRHNEFEHMKNEFKSKFTPNIASIEII